MTDHHQQNNEKIPEAYRPETIYFDTKSAQRTIFYWDEIPPDQEYYITFSEWREPAIHLSKDTISDPENTNHIEITDHYKPGFTRDKFSAIPGALRETIWPFIVPCFVVVFFTTIEQFTLSPNTPLATVDTLIAIALVGLCLLLLRDGVKRVAKIYQLRGVGHLSSMNSK